MRCILCLQKINSGEQVFWGNTVVCCGPGEIDFDYSLVSNNLMGAIHMSCLNNSVEVKEKSNWKCFESVVERSNALSLFN